jgi:hypothetical protein
VAACFIYFYHLSKAFDVSSRNYIERHPMAALKFFLFLVGDVMGVTVKPGHGDENVVLAGSVIVALAVMTVVIYCLRRDDHGGSPIGVALICFGLLFALSTTEGRVLFGYWGASASRYTTFDLLILVGVYLTLLERPAILERTREPTPPVDETHPVERRSDHVDRRLRPGIQRVLPAARWLIGAVIVIQLLLGLQNGVQGLHQWHRTQIENAQIIRDVDHAPDAELRSLAFSYSAPYLRQQIHTAERLRLSLFDTNDQGTRRGDG